LAGFIDANGCFLNKTTGKQKSSSFSLVQHSLDKELLEEIFEFLGLSKGLYFNKNQPNAWRLRTTNKADFLKVYSKINGKLITTHRYEQFAESCGGGELYYLSPLKGDPNFIHPA
jgi:hypothetical protein